MPVQNAICDQFVPSTTFSIKNEGFLNEDSRSARIKAGAYLHQMLVFDNGTTAV